MFGVMKVLLLVSGLISLSYGLQCSVSKPPSWPEAYSVKGMIRIPYAELNEPFEAWYDSKEGNSRIDYYGGMAKTFQFSSYPSNAGSNIKIVPMTTEKVLNKISCFKVDGSSPGDVTPQTIFPDISKFTCAGHGTINGGRAQKWTHTEQNEEKINKYIMWIRWKNNKLTGENEAIPVYYEMRGYDSLLGSHYDHYYINYHTYNTSKPDKFIWALPSQFKCTGFPGPGLNHVATFNPMKEFIHNNDSHIEYAWDNFKETHNKKYEGVSEHAFRRHIFKQNHRFIHSHNRAPHSYKLKLNRFADRTEDEMKALRGKMYTPDSPVGSPFSYNKTQIYHLAEDLPTNFDWRLFGAVNPVKDQSICGSCWSFGTTGTIEGAYFLKTKKLVSLSEQALIDCSWGYGNNGCDGGEDFRSYQWIQKHGGLPLEDEYGQYLAMDGKCHVKNMKLVAPITGWVDVKPLDQKALKVAIFEKGPISIGINAALKTFSFYSNGVYYDPACKGDEADLDHAVLAVGFGVMDGQDYWLIKNSWSNLWGNDGYILMAVKDNNCGVMTSPTYVTM